MANPMGRIKVTTKGGTEIMHSESKKMLFRMDAVLSAFDAEILKQLAHSAYNAGVADGERKLQLELKQLLGFDGD